MTDSLFYFNHWADFINMGGHGFYVWLAYGCFALIISWNCVAPWLNNNNKTK